MILKHDKFVFYESFSEADTEKIASKIASDSRPGDIFCLDGELGSGKTFFVKSFAKAIDIKDYVSSPTFNIIRSNHAKCKTFFQQIFFFCPFFIFAIFYQFSQNVGRILFCLYSLLPSIVALAIMKPQKLNF